MLKGRRTPYFELVEENCKNKALLVGGTKVKRW